MLLREQRGRHEHRHLLAALHGDERSAQRDLGLAEADVAADDAIHRPWRTQVVDHLGNRGRLVGSLLEREAGLERVQLRFVECESVAGAGGAA